MALELNRCSPLGRSRAGKAGRLRKGTTLSGGDKKKKNKNITMFVQIRPIKNTHPTENRYYADECVYRPARPQSSPDETCCFIL